MINTKRTQIRRNIRKQELFDLFAFKRKELLDGKASIFRQLDTQMFSTNAGMMELKLDSGLSNCLSNYPNEQNTYVLIGNYLSNKTDKIDYFISNLTSHVFHSDNKMWCLSIAMKTLSKRASDSDNYLTESVKEQAIAVAEMSFETMREIMLHLKQYQNINQRELHIWYFFMEILKLQLANELYESFPQQSTLLFQEMLQMSCMEEAEIQELTPTWLCLKTVLKHLDQVSDPTDLIMVSRGIPQLVLKHIPQQRQHCLNLIFHLFCKHPLNIMNLAFHQRTIVEILYIFEQIHTHKTNISFFLEQLIPACSMDQLVLLLDIGVHKLLTKAMDWSMVNYNNQCLQNCMGALYKLLSRLKDHHEYKLQQKILREAEELHFDEMIEGLNQQLQNKKVSNYLHLLIDEFYSDEVL